MLIIPFLKKEINTFPLAKSLPHHKISFFLTKNFKNSCEIIPPPLSPMLLLNFRQILSSYFDKTNTKNIPLKSTVKICDDTRESLIFLSNDFLKKSMLDFCSSMADCSAKK